MELTTRYPNIKPGNNYDLYTFYVDAFLVNWSQFTNNYLFPPFFSYCQMSPKTHSVTSNSNHHCTIMDHIVLVFNSSQSFNQSTKNIPSEKKGTVPPVTGWCSPSEPQTVPVGMQGVRQRFINSNVAGEITNVLMDSWRSGTRKHYDVYIRKWETFCSQEKSETAKSNRNSTQLLLS